MKCTYIIPLKQGGHVSRVFYGRCTRGLREQGQGNGMILISWSSAVVHCVFDVKSSWRSAAAARASRPEEEFRKLYWAGRQENNMLQRPGLARLRGNVLLLRRYSLGKQLSGLNYFLTLALLLNSYMSQRSICFGFATWPHLFSLP